MLNTFFFFTFHHDMLCQFCIPKQVSIKENWFHMHNSWGKRVIFWKKRFFKNLWKILTCRLKIDAAFGLNTKKYVRKRYPCLCFMTSFFVNLCNLLAKIYHQSIFDVLIRRVFRVIWKILYLLIYVRHMMSWLSSFFKFYFDWQKLQKRRENYKKFNISRTNSASYMFFKDLLLSNVRKEQT